mgnify:CR=1 FL=1
MKHASAKHAKELRQASPFRAAYLRDHPRCELWVTGLNSRFLGEPLCRGFSQVIHEPLTRARGGAIDDPENMIAVCIVCHEHIHAHPAWSEEHGFLKSAMKAGAK